MLSQVNTRTSSGYRTLRFRTVAECVAEVNRICAAEKSGTLQTTGNWTPGQIMSHVSAFIEYGYVGFPIAPPPFFVRWILRLRLSKMLRKGMPRGVRIPGIKEGTVGMQAMDASEAAQRLLTSLERLDSSEEVKFNSPAFGPMSNRDRVQLNLRHAELHLGFLVY
jgi:hypothetical protein